MTAQDRLPVREPPAIVTFTGELDAADTSWARELDSVLVHGGRELVVDLRNVTFADSSLVRELASVLRRTTEDGGWVRVVYTHHVLRRVIEICGLSELLPQYTTVAAALRDSPSHLHPDEPLA